jgi:hypothetical protein
MPTKLRLVEAWNIVTLAREDGVVSVYFNLIGRVQALLDNVAQSTDPLRFYQNRVAYEYAARIARLLQIECRRAGVALKFRNVRWNSLKAKLPKDLRREADELKAWMPVLDDSGSKELEIAYLDETAKRFGWTRARELSEQIKADERKPGAPVKNRHLYLRALSLARENPEWSWPRIAKKIGLNPRSVNAQRGRLEPLLARVGINPPRNRKQSVKNPR